MTGLRPVIGSWNTMATVSPRNRSSCRREHVTRSTPATRAEPLTLVAAGGSRPMIESAVTDLPQPLSPTMASVSPGRRSKDTPSTAACQASRNRNSVRSVSTASGLTRAA